MEDPIDILEPSQVVRIFAAVQEPDYDVPWQTDSPSSSTGSGVIIGPNRILTGAHVVADATFLQVQTVDDSDKHVAEVVAICHDSDLALLRLHDPAALGGIPPAELGDLPERRARIAVVGYPVGGEELSITEGVVSRIEVQRYAHSQRDLLAMTVDAAINSGNSGGPVVHEGRVVGIAFQSLEDAENMGEVVPAPLIRRFLRGVDEGLPLEVPGFGLETQGLENECLRRALHVPDGETGVLVKRISQGNSCYGVIEPGDVILSIDGHSIANNGTVRYKGVRTTLGVLLGERFIGERIPVLVRRGGEVLGLEIVLTQLRELVPSSRYGIEPTYFVFAGIVFQPLSRNFLQAWADWSDKAPKEFLAHYFLGHRTEERQEIIVVSQVLADEVTVGYAPLNWESIVSVNGVVPRDMADFVRLVEASPGTATLITASQGHLVFDMEEARSAEERILGRYRIPRDRSPNLARRT
ncbi:Periplasmic serine endoprotease DegP precursor [Planctomycetes bacterium Poly30]|uniref:Periplasmic serine endoprotease DegP n=1 Tax=Saltatorellus ferox TaxID=2528018 RepID=A0A518ERZ5_9BACT|nr:Periplasmic serine endoprotease DegP precursor [Planctomycetes bacterium Poly30]